MENKRITTNAEHEYLWQIQKNKQKRLYNDNTNPPLYVPNKHKPLYLFSYSTCENKEKLVSLAPNITPVVCQSAPAFSPTLSIFV